MAKKLIQDIIVKNKTTQTSTKKIDDFFAKKKPVEEKDRFDVFKNKNYEDNYSTGQNWEPEEEKVSKGSRTFLWLIGLALVVTIVFLLSSVFATAKITLTPKNSDISLNDTYYITSKLASSGLHYEVMTIEKTLSKSLETDSEEYVERKAIGKAIIYNNFSDKTQRLIINTRLKTKDGLVYKTRESVDVPGIKKGVPGSVEVEIIADQAGEKYNMKVADLKGDFSIPGFEGTPMYTGFYARLSGDVSGGLIGKIKIVSEEKLLAARDDLKNTLKDDLVKDLYSQKPEEYVIFKDNYKIEMNDLPDNSEAKGYTIQEAGKIHAITFKKKEVAAYFAKNKISDYDNSEVDVIWDDAKFKSEITGNTEKIWNEESLSAKFSGKVKIVWKYNATDIINDITGQNKDLMGDILEKYKTSIIDAEAKITPMWVKKFPQNPDKIKTINTITDSTSSLINQ